MARAGGLTPLRMPALPKIGAMPREARRPREYSVDVRKPARPRIAIAELAARGADVLRERIPEPADTRSGWRRFFDALDVPRNLIANAIASAAGMDKGPLERGTFQKRVYVSDILGKLGVPEGAARSVVGFVGDMAIDPLLWFSLAGTGGASISAYLPKIVGRAGAAMKVLRKTGRIAPLIAQAVPAGKLLTSAERAAKIAAAAARVTTPERVAKLTRAIEEARRIGFPTSGLQTALGRAQAKAVAAKTVQRVIGKAALRGRPETLAWLARHGERGRGIFRLPFMRQALGTIKVGARARKYKAVEEAIKGGAEGFAKIAGAKREMYRAAAIATSIQREARKLRASVDAALARYKTAKQKYDAVVAATRAKPTLTPVATRSLRTARREMDVARGIYEQLRSRMLKQTKLQPTLEAMRAKGGEGLKAAEARIDAALAEARKAPVPAIIGRSRVDKAILPKPPVPSMSAAELAVRRARSGLGKAAAEAPKLADYGKLAQARTPMMLAQTEAVAARLQTGRLKAMRAAAAASRQKAAAAGAEAQRLTMGAADAPAIVREALRAKVGKSVGPLERGIGATLRRAKEEMFGPGFSPVHQREVAIAGQVVGASGARARVMAEMHAKIEPIVKRLAAAGKGSPEAIRDTMTDLLEAALQGGGKLDVSIFHAADPIRKSIMDAVKTGLARDPELVGVLDDMGRKYAAYMAVEKARGVPLREAAGYAHRTLTKEGRELARLQADRLAAAGKTGGRLSVRQAPTLGRTTLLELPDGRTVLSSNISPAERAAAMKAGAREYQISTRQWNEWTRTGHGPAGVLGPEGKTIPEGMFVSSPAEAVGARAGEHQKMIAAAELRDLLSEYAVQMPRTAAAEGSAQFAHLVRVRAPTDPTNPFGRFPELFDQAYPPEVANIIKRMVAVPSEPEAVAKVIGGTDRILGLWKSLALYHPSYVVRNAFQNCFGTLMAGGNPLRSAQLATSPLVKNLREAVLTGDPTKVAGMTFRHAGGAFSGEQLYRWAQQYHLIGGGRTVQEIPAMFAGRTTGQQLLARGQRGAQAIHGAVFRANAVLEDSQRLGAFLHFLEGGNPVELALAKTLQAMPNLADLTRFEMGVMKRILPWYSWVRRNGGLQLFHYLPEKPVYAALLPKFKNFAEGLRGERNVPEELRPEWMQRAEAIQFTGGREGGTTFVPSNWLPFEDVYALGGLGFKPGESIRHFVSAVRPEVKGAIEAAAGVNLFRGTPLEPFDWSRVHRQVPQAVMGASGTALDSLLAVRPIREFGPGGRTWSMRSPGGAVGRVFMGGSFQPVDYQRGLRARYFEMDAQQRRLRAAYNRALQANDKALADSLLRQWVAVVAQMIRYKFPVSRTAEEALTAAGATPTGPP